MNGTMARPLSLVLALILTIAFTLPAGAKDNNVRFVHVSWTGVTIKTEIATTILNCLGYDAESLMVSVPFAYKALDIDEADVFLGNWMPTMESVATPYFEKGTVENLVANMPGAKYTLAVPTFMAEAGLTHFKDIAKHGDKLEWKIYGLEEGNDGNELIQMMIDKDMFGLGKFELIPSSESAMLAEVQSHIRRGEWIVFLGWAPHAMNENIEMTYLEGSTAETFGPEDGTAIVYTNVRDGFTEDYPNVTEFLKNLTFPVSMMNEIMLNLHNNNDLTTRTAGLRWVREHPDMYEQWLNGVKTSAGRPALPVFKKCIEDMDL
ncbi:MAG: ABC transporter substrate-binding protein [Desulfovibrionales bacterium]